VRAHTAAYYEMKEIGSSRDAAQTDFRAAVLIFSALFFALSSPIVFPYLLMDDNWIMRGNDQRGSYPSLEFIGALQGRPIFAALIHLSRLLASWLTPSTR
jgi:hypothetical protein